MLSCWYKENGTAGATSYYYPKNGNYYDSLEQETSQTESRDISIIPKVVRPTPLEIVRPTLLGTYLTNLR